MQLSRYANLALRNGIARIWIRHRVKRTVNIVYYHWVGGKAVHYADFYRGCTLERFRNDIRFYKRIFEIVSIDELFSAKHTEAPRLALSFDDGFDLERLGVTEVLAEQQVKAATFVITGCIDNTDLMWRNKLSVIKNSMDDVTVCRNYNDLIGKLGYPEIESTSQLLSASMNWEMRRKDQLATELWQACELPPVQEYMDENQPYFSMAGLKRWQRAGHSIGLHTHTHPLCSKLSDEELRREIIEPSRFLRIQLGIENLSFSYPFGVRLPASVEDRLLKEASLKAVLGISGFSSRSLPSRSWERECGETTGADWALLGRAAIKSLFNRRSHRGVGN
jgi:peptidoglycan/xylan/chitin deacetylase (PgdA/CDA1 family)